MNQLPQENEKQTLIESPFLGLMLSKSELIDECIIQPKELTANPYNQKILELLKYARDVQGIENIDLVVLVTLIQEKGGNVEQIGNVSYLAKLMQSVSSADNFNFYQNTIRKSYVEREIKQKLTTIALSVGNGGDVASHINRAEQEIEELKELLEVTNTETMKSFEQYLDGFHDTLEARQDKVGLIGASTLSKRLNDITGGHQRGKLEAVGGRPAMGKTAYAISDGYSVTENPKHAAIFYSKEMPGEGIRDRSVSAYGNIDGFRVRTGNLDTDDWIKYANVTRIARGRHFYIDDNPAMTYEYIKRKTKKMVKHLRSKGVEEVVIYVDYLQLLTTERSFGNDRRLEIGYMSNGFKMLARSLGITVVLLCQVNRGVEQRQDKRPMLSDLKDSGDIEQALDVCIFLYRDEYYNADSEKKNIVELLLSKHRDGEVGAIEMAYMKNYNRFIDFD